MIVKILTRPPAAPKHRARQSGPEPSGGANSTEEEAEAEGEDETALPSAEAQVAQQQQQQQASAEAQANSLISQQQAAAYAQAQEANKIANQLNAELCRNFTIGTQNENGGTFTSPDYPKTYPTNLICTRLIEG